MPEIPPDLPLDQLEELLVDQAAKTFNASVGLDNFSQAIGLQEPGSEPAPGEMPPMAADPQLVEAASSKLVQAGLLERATATLTPELLSILQQVADMNAPGLYDVSQEADLVEVLSGVANGTLPAGPAAELGAIPPTGGVSPTGAGAPGGAAGIPAVGGMGTPGGAAGVGGGGGPAPGGGLGLGPAGRGPVGPTG